MMTTMASVNGSAKQFQNGCEAVRSIRKFSNEKRISKGKERVFIKLKLINNVEFAVRMSHKADQLVEPFKALDPKYRSYDPASGKWTFSILKYNTVIRYIQKFKEETGAQMSGEIWVPVIRLLQLFHRHNEHSMKISSSEEIRKNSYTSIRKRLNPKFAKLLYDFQLEGISFIVSRAGCCVLADEIGLGKRVQAIAVADVYKGSWPLLVLCPDCIKHSWYCELLEWMPNSINYRILVVEEGNELTEDLSVYHIVVVGFSLISKHVNKLLANDFSMVIADEISCLKTSNPNFQSMGKLVANADRRLLLTSDPMYKEHKELLQYFAMVDPDKFTADFVRHAIVRYEVKNKSDEDFVNHKSEFKRLLHGTLLLRRTRVEVYSQLPFKQRKFLPFTYELTSIEQLILKNIYTKVENLLKEFKKDVEIGPRLKRKILKWYELSCRVKIRFLEDYLKTFIHMKFYKVVCFVHHDFFAQALCDVLHDQGAGYVKIDKSISPSDEEMLSKKFQDDQTVQFAVLPFNFGKKAKILLTQADCVLICELHWLPEVVYGAENLAFGVREEEPNKPFIQYFGLIKNVYHIDHILWQLLNKKLKIVNVNLTPSFEDALQTSKANLTDSLTALETFLKVDMKTIETPVKEVKTNEKRDNSREKDLAYEEYVKKWSYASEPNTNRRPSTSHTSEIVFDDDDEVLSSEKSEPEVVGFVSSKKRHASTSSSHSRSETKRRLRLRSGGNATLSDSDHSGKDLAEEDIDKPEFEDILWGREHYDPDFRPGIHKRYPTPSESSFNEYENEDDFIVDDDDEEEERDSSADSSSDNVSEESEDSESTSDSESKSESTSESEDSRGPSRSSFRSHRKYVRERLGDRRRKSKYMVPEPRTRRQQRRKERKAVRDRKARDRAQKEVQKRLRNPRKIAKSFIR